MKYPRGQTIVETLIATVIFAIIVTPFINSVANLTSSQIRNRHRSQAIQYARGGIEIVYNLAINSPSWEGFAQLADNPEKIYHPTSYPDNLALIEGEEIIGQRFVRQIKFKKAPRDESGNLDESSPTQEDQNTIRATSLVSWEDRGKQEKVELVTYLIDFELIEGD